jgi:hypothetical protein
MMSGNRRDVCEKEINNMLTITRTGPANGDLGELGDGTSDDEREYH